jgi:hypothetical protein
MASLTNALQQLRAERSRAQTQVEKLDQAISVIESLNGTGASRKATRSTRIVSAASRRKMALAQNIMVPGPSARKHIIDLPHDPLGHRDGVCDGSQEGRRMIVPVGETVERQTDAPGHKQRCRWN